jgi:branched-chain amino acid transport system ATP-binding protein
MLRVENLNSFYGNVQVVWDVSFEVKAGEVVAVIGANGAGKTTILQSVVGLVRKTGKVGFNGQDISGEPAHRMADLGIAYVPEGRKVFPEMTVRENLIIGNYSRRARPLREDLLSHVLDIFPRLKERIGNDAGTLSGGEQQMLTIGRGLMSKPVLIMLDEPSLGISPILTEEIFREIDTIKRDTTIVLVEQHVHHALAICDRGYVIEAGKLTQTGGGADLRRDPHVQRAYLGV